VLAAVGARGGGASAAVARPEREIDGAGPLARRATTGEAKEDAGDEGRHRPLACLEELARPWPAAGGAEGGPSVSSARGGGAGDESGRSSRRRWRPGSTGAPGGADEGEDRRWPERRQSGRTPDGCSLRASSRAESRRDEEDRWQGVAPDGVAARKGGGGQQRGCGGGLRVEGKEE
jgi:hypothetical protein